MPPTLPTHVSPSSSPSSSTASLKPRRPETQIQSLPFAKIDSDWVCVTLAKLELLPSPEYDRTSHVHENTLVELFT